MTAARLTALAAVIAAGLSAAALGVSLTTGGGSTADDVIDGYCSWVAAELSDDADADACRRWHTAILACSAIGVNTILNCPNPEGARTPDSGYGSQYLREAGWGN